MCMPKPITMQDGNLELKLISNTCLCTKGSTDPLHDVQKKWYLFVVESSYAHLKRAETMPAQGSNSILKAGSFAGEFNACTYKQIKSNPELDDLVTRNSDASCWIKTLI